MRNILPPSPFRSVWTFLVYCLTLSTSVWHLLSLLGNVDVITSRADSIESFLSDPVGMWVPVGVGFLLLILINYREHHRHSQTETAPAPRGGGTPDDTARKEIERLNTEIEKRDAKLQAIGQDYDQLHAMLSDPTAKRQRDERMARKRCTQVAYEVFTFMHKRLPLDDAQTVAAFKQRQQWKVDGVRDRMESSRQLTLKRAP